MIEKPDYSRKEEVLEELAKQQEEYKQKHGDTPAFMCICGDEIKHSDIIDEIRKETRDGDVYYSAVVSIIDTRKELEQKVKERGEFLEQSHSYDN